jgi:hypothetical protein
MKLFISSIWLFVAYLEIKDFIKTKNKFSHYLMVF